MAAIFKTPLSVLPFRGFLIPKKNPPKRVKQEELVPCANYSPAGHREESIGAALPVKRILHGAVAAGY